MVPNIFEPYGDRREVIATHTPTNTQDVHNIHLTDKETGSNIAILAKVMTEHPEIVCKHILITRGNPPKAFVTPLTIDRLQNPRHNWHGDLADPALEQRLIEMYRKGYIPIIIHNDLARLTYAILDMWYNISQDIRLKE